MAPDREPFDAADAAVRAERMAGLRSGLRAIAPAVVATFTWGLVTGVAMAKSGLAESAAVAMSLLVYAGSAQLTSLPLIATGAPLWLIFVAGLVVNLRFVIFGAALQPYFRDQSWPRRLAYGYFTTDMGFVLFMSRYGDAPVRGTTEQRWYFIGGAAASWLAWQASSILGVLLAAAVPADWSLDFAAVLALLAITVPLASSRPMLVSILAAGLAAWVGQALPLRLGLLAAVAAGVAAGMVAERFLRKKP